LLLFADGTVGTHVLNNGSLTVTVRGDGRITVKGDTLGAASQVILNLLLADSDVELPPQVYWFTRSADGTGYSAMLDGSTYVSNNRSPAWFRAQLSRAPLAAFGTTLTERDHEAPGQVYANQATPAYGVTIVFPVNGVWDFTSWMQLSPTSNATYPDRFVAEPSRGYSTSIPANVWTDIRAVDDGLTTIVSSAAPVEVQYERNTNDLLRLLSAPVTSEQIAGTGTPSVRAGVSDITGGTPLSVIAQYVVGGINTGDPDSPTTLVFHRPALYRVPSLANYMPPIDLDTVQGTMPIRAIWLMEAYGFARDFVLSQSGRSAA
jgi:hypothetical protein